MNEKTHDNTDSNRIYVAKLHWIIFCLPLLMLLFAILLSLYIDQVHVISLILIFCALIWILMTWFTYYFSSLSIQKKHVILCTGVLVRQTIDIPIGKIESIDIRQSLIGSIFQYGALIITGTGGSRQFINFLEKPLTCRRYIEQLMND